jgi:hypothetical protein
VGTGNREGKEGEEGKGESAREREEEKTRITRDSGSKDGMRIEQDRERTRRH